MWDTVQHSFCVPQGSLSIFQFLAERLISLRLRVSARRSKTKPFSNACLSCDWHMTQRRCSIALFACKLQGLYLADWTSACSSGNRLKSWMSFTDKSATALQPEASKSASFAAASFNLTTKLCSASAMLLTAYTIAKHFSGKGDAYRSPRKRSHTLTARSVRCSRKSVRSSIDPAPCRMKAKFCNWALDYCCSKGCCKASHQYLLLSCLNAERCQQLLSACKVRKVCGGVRYSNAGKAAFDIQTARDELLRAQSYQQNSYARAESRGHLLLTPSSPACPD